jgi:nicotinamidase-related amidase
MFLLALNIPTGLMAEEKLTLTMRSRAKDAPQKVVENTVEWNASKTALIICDMWDDHWCKSASRRVGEMAGPMNEVVQKARAKGLLIVHAPSSVVDFYKDTPQRKYAQGVPFAKAPITLSNKDRWGTKWCWPDSSLEGVLPIDDSDMGCSCAEPKCEIREAWTRQIKTIEIVGGDAIIENVILCGVHLNMCVLGRPFGIRQMVKVGKNVALLRDLTDTMYNPQRPPGVDHFTGTDLVVKHVEQFWCPTLTSADLVGGKAFRFAEDKR